MTIGPFNYSTMDEIDLLCRLPDQFIREVICFAIHYWLYTAKNYQWHCKKITIFQKYLEVRKILYFATGQNSQIIWYTNI